MAIATKINSANFLPGTGNDRFPVFSKHFNDLVDVVLEIEGADGTLSADVISEATAGSGVTIDSLLVQDGNIDLNNDALANGQIIFDADGNSYMSASADDVVDIYIAGAAHTQFTATELVIADGLNINVGAVSGSQIGTDPSALIGFFGATPVAQQATITQTYSATQTTHQLRTAAALTDNGGGAAADGTIDAIENIALSTTDTYTDAAVNNAVNALVEDTKDAVKELSDQINKIIVDQQNTAQVLNDLIDKIQALGLLA